MDVGVCGFGYSGSGAIIDLLKEYEDVSISCVDEFMLTYMPDGLIDLKYNTCDYKSRFFNSDVAIKRFLSLARKYGHFFGWEKEKCDVFYNISKEFVSNISLSWEGDWLYDFSQLSEIEKTFYYRIGSRVNRLFKRSVVTKKNKMYIPYKQSEFMNFVKKYMYDIKNMLGYDFSKVCVYNQPFAANNPFSSFPFFDDPRAIIVLRDPRDIYIMMKHFIKKDASWIPTDSVEKFIEFYKNQYVLYPDSSQILYLKFEDLIYRYTSTINEIEDFLGIKMHVRQYEFFDPSKSVNNTRLFEKIPNYSEDILKIERELDDFLFDFDKVNQMDNNGQCFWD